MTDETLEAEEISQEEEKKRSSGFYKFMILLQNTVSFINSSRPSLAAEDGEENSEISPGNIGYFWLYLKTLFYCKRWRAKIGQETKHDMMTAIVSNKYKVTNKLSLYISFNSLTHPII